jgi:hypothetical protein
MEGYFFADLQYRLGDEAAEISAGAEEYAG